MSQGSHVTLVGYVARDPRLHELKDGRHVTEIRVGTTTRVHDKTTNEWHDGDTSYYTVNCWRRLADHANASLRKGDPVVVKGRFKTRSYEDKAGRLRTEIEIVADTVGHDLNRGVASYLRQRPRAADTSDPSTSDHGTDEGAQTTTEDIDIIDEDAIERFGRELDESMDDGGLTRDNADPEAPELQESPVAMSPVPF
jgi:single-strand DNA-binding protein